MFICIKLKWWSDADFLQDTPFSANFDITVPSYFFKSKVEPLQDDLYPIVSLLFFLSMQRVTSKKNANLLTRLLLTNNWNTKRTVWPTNTVLHIHYAWIGPAFNLHPRLLVCCHQCIFLLTKKEEMNSFAVVLKMTTNLKSFLSTVT